MDSAVASHGYFRYEAFTLRGFRRTEPHVEVFRELSLSLETPLCCGSSGIRGMLVETK